MLPRPATMVTGVVVAFALAGVVRLSSRMESDPSRDGYDRADMANDPYVDERGASRDDHDAPRIDSGRYQHEIEVLESTLYQSNAPTIEDFMAISSAFRDVSFAVAERELNGRTREVAEDLAMLSAQADVGESGFVLPDVAQLRSNWESLRSQRFVDADWFHQTAPELGETQASAIGTVDPAIVADLTRSIDEIDALAEEGRRSCKELGEPFWDPARPGVDGDEHIEKWSHFGREWDDDVSRAASHMPSPPAWGTDAEVMQAYQDVTSAVLALRYVTMGNGSWPVPFETEWNARFDEAKRLLEDARARLASR